MFKTIKTSEENKKVIAELTQKLGLGAENVIARLAFAYSLKHHGKLDPNNKVHSRDAKGKEYSSNVLFGTHLPYYIALVCQRYQVHKTHKDIPRYVKLHIDHGLEAMFEQTNQRGLDFIVNEVSESV
jgi:DNA sulfur modification protein DndE